MRWVGRISDWNEDKGYGFVVPHGGGTRAFVHIKAFQYGSRRPVDGDLISYAVTTDDRGRANAVDVRYAGQKIEVRKAPLPIPRLAIGVAFLLAVAACAYVGLIPILIAAGYGVVSVVSYFAYTADKSAAGRGAQRTPESTLHLIDLLGGWPGALIAQQRSRHKTVKASFQSVFWFTVILNLAAVAWLLHSGTLGGG
ncbi:DUF1294 domain-containing protein [Lysobacter silvisoli]|uniref:DUF1294 domain-containing protein n=1 Tax=Lysobacter silvisoli TaxID=2293254 RepID=A0A371JWJ1_9GAMM|nr:cold shock and DUF1294 domain-containing protein [Lysobacter silvisoli]RDZ26022.1 DUF1294 domain-containing protein [Lysobacter silvisoli]